MVVVEYNGGGADMVDITTGWCRSELDQGEQCELGYGDLCRYFYRKLIVKHEDHNAYNVRTWSDVNSA